MSTYGRQNRGKHPKRTPEQEAALAAEIASWEVEKQKKMLALRRKVAAEAMRETFEKWLRMLDKLEGK